MAKNLVVFLIRVYVLRITVALCCKHDLHDFARDSGDKYSLIYMDDKSLVTDEPNTLCKYVKACRKRNDRIGLKVKSKQTKLIARTRKGGEKLREATERHSMKDYVNREADVLGSHYLDRGKGD